MNEKDFCVSVGIVHAKEIEFILNNSYLAGQQTVKGLQRAYCSEQGICWDGRIYHEIVFRPQTDEDSFSITNVTIGINFHWERKETQTFPGILRLISNGDELIAINILPVETYLTSVISSEMSATSSPELLKAHAVISRSWLLAQIKKRDTMHQGNEEKQQPSFTRTDDTLIRWYDREDHTLYDVCADDHCQRYQGITRATNPAVYEAVHATGGQVLTSEGQICDARFSKCCGGISEEFDTCWEDKQFSYLKAVRDNSDSAPLPDLTREEEADQWIRSAPPTFCNTADHEVLRQILNSYDQETTDFYRWKVDYTQEELAALIRQRSGIDFGHIISLKPVRRGPSGRIELLKITGTQQTLTVGKELEIRRILSHTHLFSSAFIVDTENCKDGIPQKFILTGAGWGHGVGLCQIGAAMMARQGYNYTDILLHYYRGAQIEKLYEP